MHAMQDLPTALSLGTTDANTEIARQRDDPSYGQDYKIDGNGNRVPLNRASARAQPDTRPRQERRADRTRAEKKATQKRAGRATG